jgi:hypothetical protein
MDEKEKMRLKIEQPPFSDVGDKIIKLFEKLRPRRNPTTPDE